MGIRPGRPRCVDGASRTGLDERIGDDFHAIERRVYSTRVAWISEDITLPSYPRASDAGIHFSSKQGDDYDGLIDAPFRGLPKHQLGGLPSPVQDDWMELECQLVSNGVYCGGSSEVGDPSTHSLAAGAKDWRLLLQVDSDDSMQVAWGDGGKLYYFIRERDARIRNFANTWVVLQCG